MDELERLEDSVMGYGIWRKPTPVGGYEYYTDDCGIGRRFWNDAIDDPRLVFEILDREGSLQRWLDSYYEYKKQYGEADG